MPVERCRVILNSLHKSATFVTFSGKRMSTTHEARDQDTTPHNATKYLMNREIFPHFLPLKALEGSHARCENGTP
jgi:hypothetical protein